MLLNSMLLNNSFLFIGVSASFSVVNVYVGLFMTFTGYFGVKQNRPRAVASLANGGSTARLATQSLLHNSIRAITWATGLHLHLLPVNGTRRNAKCFICQRSLVAVIAAHLFISKDRKACEYSRFLPDWCLWIHLTCCCSPRICAIG